MQKRNIHFFTFNIKIILGKEKYKMNLFILFNLFEWIYLINQQILNLKKNCEKILSWSIFLYSYSFVFIFYWIYISWLNCKVFIIYILYNVLCFRALFFSLSLCLFRTNIFLLHLIFFILGKKLFYLFNCNW